MCEPVNAIILRALVTATVVFPHHYLHNEVFVIELRVAALTRLCFSQNSRESIASPCLSLSVTSEMTPRVPLVARPVDLLYFAFFLVGRHLGYWQLL